MLPSLVTQGITTIAVGHCGASLGPLPNLEALRSMQKWRSITGANLNWLNFEEFLRNLEGYPMGPNILSLVGHSTLRRGLVGDSIREATDEEIKIETKLLSESLSAGAAGMSFGLVYAHEINVAKEELLATAKVVAGQHKLLSTHLRSESSRVVEALDEVIDLAKTSGARLKISHFKIQGEKNWSLLEQVLGSLERAYQSGVDIFFDVYPYTTSWSVLYTYLPKWAYEGGKKAMLKNLKDETSRSKILNYLSEQTNLGQVIIATSETNPVFVGKTLDQIAKNQEVGVCEALLNVLTGTEGQVVVFDHNLSPNVLETLIKHPLGLIATDGAGYDLENYSEQGLVHPRCFGAIPKFFSMVREKKLMTWPEAVKKVTSRPAEKLRLQKRGKLRSGFFADIVVFDPHGVLSRASYQNPYIQSDGVEHVIINGKPLVVSSEMRLRRAGTVLRIR